jgi:hypothetical protein
VVALNHNQAQTALLETLDQGTHALEAMMNRVCQQPQTRARNVR